MMTRPPVSMWPTTEHAYKGFGEIICVVNPAQQKRTVNTAAGPGAKVTYLYNDLAEKLYDEAQRNVSGKVEKCYFDHLCGFNSCRNCKHYAASYARSYDGNFRELQEGKCHRKSVLGAKAKATDTCEHFQR